MKLHNFSEKPAEHQANKTLIKQLINRADSALTAVNQLALIKWLN